MMASTLLPLSGGNLSDGGPSPGSSRVAPRPAPWPLPDLRAHVRQGAGEACEWPACERRGRELAHLRHRGMGGAPSQNYPENVVWLCVPHHRAFDSVNVELEDLLDLFSEVAQRTGFGCVWPTCHNTAATFAPGDKELGVCELHAAVFRPASMGSARRHEIRLLLRVIALRREEW